MKWLPNKHYSGHHKDIEEQGDHRTREEDLKKDKRVHQAHDRRDC